MIGTLSLLLLGTLAQAGEGGQGFGIGVVLGEPTGVTLGVGLTGKTSLQAHLAWSLGKDAVRANVDYLYHPVMKPIPDGGFNLGFYVGAGAVVGVWDDGPVADVALGVRVPIGLQLVPNGAPVDVFAEVAPGVYLLPYTDVLVEGGLGVRYWF